LTIAEAFSLRSQANTSSFRVNFVKRVSFVKTAKMKRQLHKDRKKLHQMARVRSTARVTREGEETEVTETAPIFEVMKQSGLVVMEEKIDEGTAIAEADQTVVEEDIEEDEEDYSILIPSKPSHLDFEKSTVSEADMPMMMKFGYFGEAERKLVRFAEEETTPAPKDDEVVVFRSFFKA
jgi:cellobiose phosphorylase